MFCQSGTATERLAESWFVQGLPRSNDMKNASTSQGVKRPPTGIHKLGTNLIDLLCNVTLLVRLAHCALSYITRGIACSPPISMMQ
eukprot:4942477-Amphidinium_carterae.1